MAFEEEGVSERSVQVESLWRSSTMLLLLEIVELLWILLGAIICCKFEVFLLLYTLFCSLCFLAIMTCQWFFTPLSVLPGNSLAIIDHLLPYILCAVNSLSSSSSVNAFLLILGSSWLNHLSLQLFPEKEFRRCEFWVETEVSSSSIGIWLNSEFKCGMFWVKKLGTFFHPIPITFYY